MTQPNPTCLQGQLDIIHQLAMVDIGKLLSCQELSGDSFQEVGVGQVIRIVVSFKSSQGLILEDSWARDDSWTLDFESPEPFSRLLFRPASSWLSSESWASRWVSQFGGPWWHDHRKCQWSGLSQPFLFRCIFSWTNSHYSWLVAMDEGWLVLCTLLGKD